MDRSEGLLHTNHDPPHFTLLTQKGKKEENPATFDDLTHTLLLSFCVHLVHGGRRDAKPEQRELQVG